MVLIKNIRLESHCEHHIVPILGKAHIAYMPKKRVVGISKIARLVDVFAKRLQIQETLTSQIAETLQSVLDPLGVAVLIDASHQCMTTRGVHKPESSTVTKKMIGIYNEDKILKQIVEANVNPIKKIPYVSPDFIIKKPYLIAVEYKQSGNGSLVKQAIGQSMMHAMSKDFDYVFRG